MLNSINFSTHAGQLLEIGSEVDRYRDVPVFENGSKKNTSHGRHFSNKGYYYGQKWQCVEFVKRFYFQAMDHKMPDVWGHAKDFFDAHIDQGEINPRRNLLQFRNGGDVKPAVDDIIVFSDSHYGHMVIVTKVNNKNIEVIQQNIHGSPRQLFQLQEENGLFLISSPRVPDGWLRIARTANKVQHGK